MCFKPLSHEGAKGALPEWPQPSCWLRRKNAPPQLAMAIKGARGRLGTKTLTGAF